MTSDDAGHCVRSCSNDGHCEAGLTCTFNGERVTDPATGDVVEDAFGEPVTADQGVGMCL